MLNKIISLLLVVNIYASPLLAMHIAEYGNTIADQKMLSDQLELKKERLDNLILLLKDTKRRWPVEDIYGQSKINFEGCAYLVYSFLIDKKISPDAHYNDKINKDNNHYLSFLTMLFLSNDLQKKFPMLYQKLHYEKKEKFLLEQLNRYPKTSVMYQLIQQIFIQAQKVLTENKSPTSKKLD